MIAPTILRGSIYTSLAVLTSFSGWLEKLTPEKVSSLVWTDWSAMAVTVSVSGLIALRAYIDGSNERARLNQQVSGDLTRKPL